jgi:hypothetical protein
MKKKHLLMTSVNGVNKYACPKCGAEMKHADNYSMRFCGGDIVETGDEHLVCACGMTSNYPKMRVSEFRHLAIG